MFKFSNQLIMPTMTSFDLVEEHSPILNYLIGPISNVFNWLQFPTVNLSHELLRARKKSAVSSRSFFPSIRSRHLVVAVSL